MTDIPNEQGRKRSLNLSRSVDVPTPGRTQEGEAHVPRPKISSTDAQNGYDFDRLFSAGENSREQSTYGPGPAADKEFSKFQDRLRKGKVKLCASCGGVMNKSSRMILSSIGGILLIAVGVALIVGYGLATNFFQTPWYIRYALPASYYVGSIFVAVGILFFFIRERIWYCPKCKAIDKR